MSPEPVEGPAKARSARGFADAGARIDTLLNALSAGGPLARERAEELVRVVTDLYGAGLEQLLTLLYERGRLDAEILEALATDDLVSNLLLVHGLHPYGVETRVERALDSVRPYLGSHGGDVELVAVGDDTVRLRLLGTCDGCPSSSATLQLAVEGAITAAAPEISAIEVEPAASSSRGVIPVEALRSRLDEPAADRAPGHWHPVPEAGELSDAEVATAMVAGLRLMICRSGSDLYPFEDRCPRCDSSFSGAGLGRRLGGRAGDAVLRCPQCLAHFDVRRAGAGLDDPALHLDPRPLLTGGGTVSVALPETPAAQPAIA